MEREETVKVELMVEKLKRGILVGKREGYSTPSPTWKFGAIQADGTLISDSKFSPNLRALSARKLGANLWEMEKLSKIEPNFGHRRSQEVKIPSKQETSGGNLTTSLIRHNARVENVGQAQQPLSPASYSSSKEMAARRSVMSPNGSLVANSKCGESSRSLKTSTELLKVLNRIWSLEEKHALDMSLVKTLSRELDQSKSRIQELMEEKKRDKNEVGSLMKQLREYKVARKKDQEQIKDTVKSVEAKLEDEVKLRRHSEKRHHKLAKELSEIKCSFGDALRELEHERKARVMLEDLCDAFAKGIRDYEQEIRVLKHKGRSTDEIGTEGNDRLILHISEAWLDERTQMKLADACDSVSEKQSVLDKLCLDIESFLREKQCGNPRRIQDVYPKSPGENNILSFHLNEPASAPWNAKDEDDSIGVIPQFYRDRSLKQAKETPETKAVNRNVQSRIENLNETSDPRTPRKGEMMQRSSRERKNRATDTDLEDRKLRHGYNCMESSFADPSTLVGPPSPVKKWISEAPVGGQDVSESSSKWPKTTLKAKLMEARQEKLQSRTRTSKSLSQGD